MAEKDNKPKVTPKASPSAKSSQATTKPAATVKPAASVKPAAKPATATSSAAKSSGIMGSAASKQPATAAKPTATATRPAATAKPAASVKPAAKPTTATPSAAKSSGIMGSAANKQPATATKPTATATKPAASVKPAATPATAAKSSGIMGSAANKQPATSAKPTATATKPAATSAPAASSSEQKAKTAAETPVAAKSVAAAKTEKPAKQQKIKQTKQKKSQGGGNGGAAEVARANNKKPLIIIFSAVAFVLIAAIIIGIVAGTKSCNTVKLPQLSKEPPTVSETATVTNDKPVSKDTLILNPVDTSDPAIADLIADQYKYEYAATTAVGFTSEIINSDVERVKPVAETRDERDQFSLGDEIEEAIANAGSVRYPRYGSTMNSVVGNDPNGLKADARDALIDESDYLTAYGTRNNSGNGNNGEASYNMMDKDGYLYFVNNGTTTPATNPDGSHRQLYKHSAAEGMYLEGFDGIPMLSDEEPAIVKQVTIRPRGYGSYSVTGVYAPAGEVIKIEISEADMNATGGITIHIGQALYNGQSNNIWTAKGQMQRFPNILNTMVVNKSTATLENGVYTAYVGSFIGGPLYIRNTSATFTATISGGVAYQHFILGYTTKEEFEANKNSTAPYFDVEVWNYGVLHSGPKYYARNFSYDDIYKAAVLWEKVSSVTTTGSNQGIVFLYDPFVAAGAAVAFPGRSSVNCPPGWMTNSLNYNGIVTSGGWGNFHEYHHNFQGYGVGNGGEVTNNGMTLVSYALFTKISSKRGIESYGGQGLGGWNNYTSATWALNDLLSLQRGGTPSNGKQGLALYATLLHNFGANNYIQAKVQGGGQSYAAYMNAWQKVTHNNMYYYFNDVLKGSGISNNADSSYPMFVPVSCVYQTGRSYMYDGEKKYFKTMQPYMIAANETFDIDLSQYTAPLGQYASGSIVIPDGFTYRVKSVTKPARGTIELTETNTLLKYTPAANAKTGDTSGQIVVTLEIVKNDGAFKVDDVDLVLEFEISQEINRMTLERTTYTYTTETMYTDAKAAYENDFAGYTGEPLNWDHTNPTQNCNTDIWLCTPTTISNFPKADPEKHVAKENTVEVLKGKLYFEEEGKYRIYLRGRVNCAVFITYTDADGEVQNKSAQVTNGSGSGFYTTNPDTYIDIEVGGETFVSFTEVLIVKLINGSQASYIGLGYGKWQEPMYTMGEKHYDANGNEVASPDAEGYDHSETVYYDNAGHEVDPDVVAAAQPTPPTSVSYVNAYRSNYDFPDNTSFESEYFYTRSYNYNYADNKLLGTAEKNVKSASGMSLSTSWGAGYNDLGVILDGITNQGDKLQLHSSTAPSEAKPFIFEIDLGEECTANRFIFYTQNRSDPHYPKAMNLYSSLDGENYTLIGNYADLKMSGNTVTINFDETEMRYYKMEITKSSSSYIIMRELEMWHINEINGNGSNLIAPTNDKIIFSKNWSSQIAPSTFGRVHVGHAGDKAVFEFTGTRLAILTSDSYGKNFDVYIDGKKASSIDVVQHSGAYGITYLSEKLASGKHKVEIRCTGEANIDSIAIYNET